MPHGIGMQPRHRARWDLLSRSPVHSGAGRFHGLGHKAKAVYVKYGIPTPRGIVAVRPEEIHDTPNPALGV